MKNTYVSRVGRLALTLAALGVVIGISVPARAALVVAVPFVLGKIVIAVVGLGSAPLYCPAPCLASPQGIAALLIILDQQEGADRNVDSIARQLETEYDLPQGSIDDLAKLIFNNAMLAAQANAENPGANAKIPLSAEEFDLATTASIRHLPGFLKLQKDLLEK